MTAPTDVWGHLPTSPNRRSKTAAQALLAHVTVIGECWEWTGARQPNGYGKVGRNGVTVLAHRLAYAVTFGAIPASLTIDHLCRNRACIRPDHLEAVTGAENTRRGADARLSDTCPDGHRFTPENTAFQGRTRRCLACRRARLRSHNERLKRELHERLADGRLHHGQSTTYKAGCRCDVCRTATSRRRSTAGALS